ncbi:MAG: hypothetical protein MUC49_01450 [Raineya sp.]|nr:hypothetical protein [Raineya sp.]
MKKYKDIIEVNVYWGGKHLFTCNYLYLEPHSSEFSRKFTFHNIEYKYFYETNLYHTSSDGTLRKMEAHVKEMEVKVSFFTKKRKKVSLSTFKMYLYDHSKLYEGDTWWAYGNILLDKYTDYGQYGIDMLFDWQNGKTTIDDWFDLPIGSDVKHVYLVLCLHWRDTDNPLNIKDKYTIDTSLIKEECDLSYLCSLEFVGDRGFLGIEYSEFKHSFKNLIFNIGHSVEGIKVYLLNVDKPYNEEMATFYQEYKKLFEECKFDVIELKDGELP